MSACWLSELYFVLPTPMLGRPLSNMAMLVVQATTTLAVEAGLAVGGLSPQRRMEHDGVAASNERQRKSTACVAPLLIGSGRASCTGGRDGAGVDWWRRDGAQTAADRLTEACALTIALQY